MRTKADEVFILEEYLYQLDVEVESLIKTIEMHSVNTEEEKIHLNELYDVLKKKLDIHTILRGWINDLNTK